MEGCGPLHRHFDRLVVRDRAFRTLLAGRLFLASALTLTQASNLRTMLVWRHDGSDL